MSSGFSGSYGNKTENGTILDHGCFLLGAVFSVAESEAGIEKYTKKLSRVGVGP